MGNMCSSSSGDVGNLPQPREIKSLTPEWDPNPHNVTKGKGNLSQGVSQPPSYHIVVQDESESLLKEQGNAQLPTYSSTARPGSVVSMLHTWKAANDLRYFGIKGVFNALHGRHFHVWIDSNYKLLPVTKFAIQLLALSVLQVAKAIDCDMTIFFTGFPNKNSSQLSSEGKVRLDALNQLWVTQSWQEAASLAARTQKLRELGIQDWMNNPENWNPEESDGERHTRLLSYVREKMLPYWHGWHQRELTMDRLVKVHNSAIRAAKQQPKSLNNIRFTYERETKHYLRLMKRDEAYPLTALFLLASAMQPSEIAAIQKCQKDRAEIKKQKRQLLPRDQKDEDVEGRGTQFCIESIVMTENMDATAIKGYNQIDNFASGEDDVNDMTPVKESKILKYFLSPKCLFKILNCHNPDVDNNMELPESETYGTQILTHGGYVLTMPWLSEFKKIFGIEDDANLEYDDDEDDANLASHPATNIAIDTTDSNTDLPNLGNYAALSSSQATRINSIDSPNISHGSRLDELDFWDQ